MTNQDLLTIAFLVTVILVVFLFPGGPGTPKRFWLPSLEPGLFGCSA